MKKRFNITGLCVPDKHYMVDISEQLEQIRELVDEGAYFTINRARQYGKTTTLAALAKVLKDDYLVVSLDFQALGSASFDNENKFSIAFASCFLDELKYKTGEISSRGEDIINELSKAVMDHESTLELMQLFKRLQFICVSSTKPIVLMIDEVDSATNNQVFLDFLAQLRNHYLNRDKKGTVTFQSVILAGVYDVKNLKRKIRADEVHKMNSPKLSQGLYFWNIAADFDVVMSFSKSGITGMLEEYEADYRTGMDIDEMSGLLYDYTAGYPFLVSRLCKLMDEKISKLELFGTKSSAWTKEGFLEAERMIQSEKNTLFESLNNKLTDYPDLNVMLNSLLFTGKNIGYNPDNQAINTAAMFGFIKNQNNIVMIANRIFETRLYNLYLSTSQMQGLDIYTASLRDMNQFIVDGHLNMRRILEKFVVHFNDLYSDQDETFLEEEGRKYFLLYLRPIINGTGNYYIESQTRGLRRTDVIVDYNGEQHVIEMKIWRGQEYNDRGEKQLTEYLDDYHINKGYMVSFNFNKNKKIGVHEIVIDDKLLIEVVV